LSATWSVRRTCLPSAPGLTGDVARLYSDSSCTNLIGITSSPSSCTPIANAAPYIAADFVCGASSSQALLYQSSSCTGSGTPVSGFPSFPAAGTCTAWSGNLPGIGPVSGFGRVTCSGHIVSVGAAIMVCLFLIGVSTLI
jgi:hypothetical protein